MTNHSAHGPRKSAIGRVTRLSIVAVTVLALSACASGATPGTAASGAAAPSGRAVIQLAVSEACAAGATTTCVSVHGEDIAEPATYEDAEVQNAEVVEGNGQSAVNVTFTDDGGRVLNTVSRQAAEAGNGTRLVLKAGGTIIGAPVALAPLEGREVSIAVSPDDSAQELVDTILGR